MCRAASADFVFKKEEKVLAYHGPLIHEAKVEEAVARDAPDGKTKVKLYLLHYDGWNSHWDEWVPESRVLKDTHDGRAKQKERIREFQRAHKRKKQEQSTNAGKAKAAKTAGGASGVADESLLAEIREQLRLPHGAKLKLIEDWERITRERKLVTLPHKVPISTILDDFVAAKARRTSHERLYGEVCDGVRAYFNQALPTCLLYKYERRQYREAKEHNKQQSADQYYGAEHLLRLYVKLPELLARCHMQREHMTVLVAKLSELLKFLVTGKAKYFANEYEQPDEEYMRWWAKEGD